MAYQYGHHRPLTPITPVHSPHPSFGSIRTRTPGQLSLHDYRKQQDTPSPPAVRGQKTVKRKVAASSLKNIEGIAPDSPNAPLLPPSRFESTPPLTPSVGSSPPHFQTSLPPSFQTGTFTQFFPELAYLASTDLDVSPPQSPSFFQPPPSESFLPDLLPSPTTSQLQHTSSSFASKRPLYSPQAHLHSTSEHGHVSEQSERSVRVAHDYLNHPRSRGFESRASTRAHRRESIVPLLSGPHLPEFGINRGAAEQISRAASVIQEPDWRGVTGSDEKERKLQDVRGRGGKQEGLQRVSLQAQKP
jgi:hypothetical protein